MDSIRVDPELAQEMVTLLGRELKAARQTIQTMKAESDHNDKNQELETARREIVMLSAQLELAEENARRDASELKNALEEIDKLKAKGEPADGGTLLYDNVEFKRFMKHLKAPNGQPHRKSLDPIYNNAKCSKMELRDYLDSMNISSDFLYFPGCLRWSVGVYNALAFGPLHVLENSTSIFEGLHGQELDLYHSVGQGVHYAGVYRCHHARRWFPDGVRLPKDISFKAFVEAQEEVGSKTGHLNEMYRDGGAKADFLVLECVGFNHALYETLRQDVTMPSKRQLQDQDDNGPQCRRKRVKTTD